jgi:hypothetical protein
MANPFEFCAIGLVRTSTLPLLMMTLPLRASRSSACLPRRMRASVWQVLLRRPAVTSQRSFLPS